ncbi:N-acetyl-gamma-glutamyl-phosphate/LysW-gamma-L-alpha-aminoadipyl-6-phosphate reductase [Deinococcus sp. HSC-46F16]|uniref:N-acetyl-gamma-glutamyl-phosphate reductase n=1 Tax=Deinococcus sp. HSC-46F16 TaxID=2910968 RepID=UPI0020A0B85D|nr:N-acetyl-gamma-glutamyl-phosphate reductase [Deinococcus sp. HSC-46F16]MCP2013257.1 N-acetyl-gamma-glutamyl-phosphate/LysW-gamma-L-alpha-aminoadipyl-6-phosphate reductase [Deinococcus sp. HSC-46F16]
MSERVSVALVGGDTPQGAEFLRMALAHPYLEVTGVSARAHIGHPVAEVYPTLRGVTRLGFRAASDLGEADVLVLADAVEDGPTEGTRLTLDLTGHRVAEALTPGSGWVYGLPERMRSALRGTARVAAPGDLATAAVLTLAPLLERGVLLPRGLRLTELRGASVSAFAVGHDQAEEIARALPGRFPLEFTAAGLPGMAGLLLLAEAWVPDGYSDRDVWSAYREAYAGETFVRLLPGDTPDPARLRGTPFIELGTSLDLDSGRVLLAAALDPRGRGGAGQALQSLNLTLGWPEGTGLGFTGLLP